MTLIRTRTTPETFAADFMATPGSYPDCFPAFRRKYINIVQEVLRRHDPRLLGGPILREMVKADQLTIAEAVRDIWELAEAEAEVPDNFMSDPIAKAIHDELEELERLASPKLWQESDNPYHEQGMAVHARMMARQRELAVDHLREQGENALADLAEYFPNTLDLLIASTKTRSYESGHGITPAESLEV